MEDNCHTRKHADCITSCSEYISSRHGEGYSQCKAELDKKQMYTEKFGDFQKDMSSSMGHLIKLIEQDYSTLKSQLVIYLDSSKERIISKAEAVLQARLKEVSDSIEKISSVKSFDDVKKSQADQAAALRKDLESSPVADEILFHKIYNCVNAFVLEEKLTRTNMQEAEESRRQFKSKKFELLCGIFQDYQLNQKEDIVKLQDILNEFYDQKKKTEIKTIFKEKIDKVFNSDIEAQQIDTKMTQGSLHHNPSLVTPVKMVGPHSSQNTEALIKFTIKFCTELGTIIDTSEAQSLASIPVVAKLLNHEMYKRKEAKAALMEKERKAAEALKLKEKLASQATVKQNLEALKKQKELSRDKVLGLDSFYGNMFNDSMPAESASSGNLIQAAKALAISKRHTDESEAVHDPLNPKIIEVDNLLSKLKKIQMSYNQDKKDGKKIEKLSDLVTTKKDEKERVERDVLNLKMIPSSRVQLVPPMADLIEPPLYIAPPIEKASVLPFKLQNDTKREYIHKETSRPNRSFKENVKTNEPQRRWGHNSRSFESKNHHQKSSHYSDLHPSLKETKSGHTANHVEYQENGAMQVIQTLVLSSVNEPRTEVFGHMPVRTNLSKRPPQRSSHSREPQDEVLFTQEDSSNILRPARTNMQESIKDAKHLHITPDCKVLPYKLKRSDDQGLVHANHSEYQLSKGNSFYFTGCDPTDYIEVVLQKESFVSSVLVEPPRLSHDHALNVSRVNGASLYTFRNDRWERISHLDFKGQKQVIVPINMRASVFRIAHGKTMDPTAALGIGRLTVMG